MAQLQSFSETAPFSYQRTITSASTTVAQVIFPSRDSLARVDAVLVSNDDTSSHQLTVTMDTSNGTGFLGTTFIPSRAGHDGNAPVELLSRILPTGVSGLALNDAAQLYAASIATLPGGVNIQFTALGGRL